MATFTKRGDKWRAQVRVKGAKPQYATFATKAAAEAWASEIEDKEKLIALTGRSRAPAGMTVAELFALWIEDCAESRHPENVKWEKRKLAEWSDNPDHGLGFLKLSAVSAEHFEAFKMRRLREAKPSTVAREMGFMSGVFTWAHKIKKIIPVQPMSGVKWPAVPKKSRSRRVSEAELIEVCKVLGYDRVSAPVKSRHRVAWIWEFMIETGLRGGEVLALEWRDIDFGRRVLMVRGEELRAAKTAATRREVPLSPRAVQLLTLAKEAADLIAKGQFVPRGRDRSHKVMPIGHGNKDKINNEILSPALEEKGIIDLNCHDCRHEAITRMARSGIMPPDLMRIVGHSALEETMRYYEFSADQIAAKMHGEALNETSVFEQVRDIAPVEIEAELEAEGEVPSEAAIVAALKSMDAKTRAALLASLSK